MILWTIAAPAMLASFMGAGVECVEALTIVLAVGTVRGWRSALLGVSAALAVLICLVAILGPSLTRIPLDWVQLTVGTLSLLFGLRWLRKAILRAAGAKPLHNEAVAYEKETANLRSIESVTPCRVDVLAFMTSFKIVMLEGIEVVFIVIAIGSSTQLMVPACLGALLALGAVIVLGLALHRPLTRVPENSLKFAVGAMLSAFGTFWVGEGIGVEWPGADVYLLALIVAFLGIAFLLVKVVIGRAKIPTLQSQSTSASSSPTKLGAIALVRNELFGLFVDDARFAGGIVVWVLIGWFLEGRITFGVHADGVCFAMGLLGILALNVLSSKKN
ncbi:TMEM165/GDT1 family protein [Robbsia sp. Bb-Pol-6]|uniref:TMEM165/GDT1 family protein n=1 Tax=Robbsia betulipollinis TaxID=2981849 RepID=A0ABT3ZPG2_9BURK|nr:FTR1 family protein [Robbsia betulipollinis]MCY0388420.1 TMEM165/GDT1 family protein [Robbsia betulipollinis]